MKMTLCTPCAEKLRSTNGMKKGPTKADNKITCEYCGRRRYGATYEVTPKKGA